MFGSEYNWSLTHTMSHSLFQLKSLGQAIAERLYTNRAVSANLMRIAHHAKKQDYERYLDTLRPSTNQPLAASKRGRGTSDLPEGFAYSRKRKK